MTSIEMASQHVNPANNEEESIFLTSSDDDKDHESVDRDEYLAQERAGYGEDASDNDDDFAYGNSYDDEDMDRDDERRPIKVYDDYDPDNMDNNEDDSDDDIPLNLYSQKKRQLEQSKQESAARDSDVEPVDESSSDEDKASKRTRPKRALEVKAAKRPKSGRLLPARTELKKRASGRKSTHTDSDSGSSSSSSSASSLGSHSKSKQVKKNPPKENENTDGTSRHLVKRAAVSQKQKRSETSKLSQAQNIISGRVINFESGFKIPKRPSNESSNDKEPPEKKTKTEEKSTIEKTKVKDTKETVKAKASKPISMSSARPLTEKKVDKKPQPVKNGFKESVDFLEALSSSSSRKHSHSSKKAPLPSVPKIETTASAAPAAKNESSQDKKSESSLKTNLESTCNSTPCLINRVETVDNTDPTSLLDSHSSSSDSNLLKANSNGLKSNLIISGTKKIAKKKVIWADSCSQQLESVQLFYLDESERVIKKEAYHGADMSKVDKLSEKEFTFRITSGHGFGDFSEEAVSPWPASLTPIDLPESTIAPEIRSEEREVQARREANTLAVLVFKKFMPDSASEPDAEPACDAPKPRIIPLDEINSGETKLPSEEAPHTEQEKFYTPGQETKSKPPLLSNPAPKTPLLPTPPVQPPSSSTEASGSKSEPASILNLLNLSNLSSSILRSNEDAERLKKILSLVGAPESKGDELAADADQPIAKNNIPKTDTNNNPRWNHNWQTHKHSNQTFNRNQNSSQNQSQGRNVFVNNFKRGMGTRAPAPYTHGHNYRGNDSRANFSRQNYAMHGQNRSRFGENKSYEEGERPESKSNQGGRWI